MGVNVFYIYGKYCKGLNIYLKASDLNQKWLLKLADNRFV